MKVCRERPMWGCLVKCPLGVGNFVKCMVVDMGCVCCVVVSVGGSYGCVLPGYV